MKSLYGVIGNPIAHSLSPQMHNDLFQFYSIDAHYQAFQVKPHLLKEAIEGFRAIGIQGFNVTIPHKVNILPLLDQVDPLAEAIGAVNTVVNKNGTLIGYNTDGSGFLQGLKSQLESLTDLNVLIVGAGGAARAIYYSMAYEGVNNIDITNRTIEKGEALADECPYKVNTNVWEIAEAESKLIQYDIIVQTTSIGMAPNVEGVPLNLHRLKEGCLVCDIIYNPLETAFMKQAKDLGATIQNGIEMFVCQGALAFEKWTGISPNIERMRKLVIQKLGG